MSKSSKTNPPVNTKATITELILAYLGVGLIIVGAIAYLANLIIAMNVARDAFAQGNFVMIGYVAYFAVPTGFICIFVLLFKSMLRRGKERKEAENHK